MLTSFILTNPYVKQRKIRKQDDCSHLGTDENTRNKSFRKLCCIRLPKKKATKKNPSTLSVEPPFPSDKATRMYAQNVKIWPEKYISHKKTSISVMN